jgi:hypothetical protein
MGKIRKNIETFNKYIAGLVDGNGCITVNFYKTRNGTYKARFIFSISTNLSYKKGRQTLEEIMDYFNCGSIYENEKRNVVEYIVPDSNKAISCVERIKKHLVIKGQHADRMIQLYKEKRGYGETYTEEEVKKLREYVKWSRNNTTSIKPKKHLTNAWLAGYIDADGYLSFKENNMCLDFGCHPKDRPALELISKAFGRKIVQGRKNELRLRHYFSKKNPTLARRILIPLLPHLRIKKWDAEQILAKYNKKTDTRRD